jgi:HPt (histidine-containing phosphotransfer) domain-containing protein
MSRQLTVLVADSTAVGRQHAAFLFSKRGHKVQTVGTAADLLASLNSAIDLILIHLPFSGVDAAILARDVRLLAPLAAVFALAPVRAEGFDETVIAPLSPVTLDDALRNLIRPIVDLPHLLQMLDNNRDLLRQLVAALGPAVDSGLAAIKAAIEAGDCDALAGTAHRLKGSLGHLAADEAVAAARRLEELGKSRDLRLARAALAKLDLATRRVRAELRAVT